MALVNDNYLKLKAGYLFPEIGRRLYAPHPKHTELWHVTRLRYKLH